jgi:hypothetical protein
VANQDCRCDPETRAPAEELRAGENDHARADRADDPHANQHGPTRLLDSQRRESPCGGNQDGLDQD